MCVCVGGGGNTAGARGPVLLPGGLLLSPLVARMSSLPKAEMWLGSSPSRLSPSLPVLGAAGGGLRSACPPGPPGTTVS